MYVPSIINIIIKKYFYIMYYLPLIKIILISLFFFYNLEFIGYKIKYNTYSFISMMQFQKNVLYNHDYNLKEIYNILLMKKPEDFQIDLTTRKIRSFYIFNLLLFLTYIFGDFTSNSCFINKTFLYIPIYVYAFGYAFLLFNLITLCVVCFMYSHCNNKLALPILKLLSLFNLCKINYVSHQSLYNYNVGDEIIPLDIYKKYDITVNELIIRDKLNNITIPNNVKSITYFIKDNINYLPNSLIDSKIETDNLYNNLPSSLLSITLYSNHKVNNLPYSLKKIELYNNTNNLYKLPNTINKLTLVKYQQELSSIPNTITNLTLKEYNKPIDFLSEHITHLELININNIGNKINDLPFNIIELKFHNDFQYYQQNYHVKNLPSSIKTIYLQKDNVKYFEKYSNIIKIIK